MVRIERIVVGVDLNGDGIGPTAALAIGEARLVAKAAHAHVTLVHSRHDDERWNDAEGSFESIAPAATKPESDPIEHAARELRDAGIETSVVISDEPPAVAILRQVLGEEASLVIVGKRTTPHHDGRRLGGVSTNVIRNAPCLVSVVKPGASDSPKMIVAASDAGEVGARVVEASGALANLFGAELHVVHAIQLSMETQMQGSDAEHAFVDARRAEIRRQVDAQIAEAGFAGPAHVHAGVTTPTRAVLEAVERLNPDVVVMGTVSRVGIPGMIVGNTAERLLGLLDCSLLVAKPAGFVCPIELD